MKEREQTIGTKGRVTRGLAAVGLFLAGCAPSAAELVQKPEVSLRTSNYHIERVGIKILSVTGEGTWQRQYDPNREAGVNYLRGVCTIEAILTSIEPRTVNVVVSNDSCFPIAPSAK